MVNGTSGDPAEAALAGKPEPVFAPGVPADVRKLLTDKPGAMIPAGRSASRPAAPFPAGTAGQIMAWITSGVVVTVSLANILDGNQWALPDGVWDWLWTALRVVVALYVGQTILAFHRSSSTARVGFEYHGQYLKAKDWDAEARQLMLRAQRAVREVQQADVTKHGLLDDLQNDVVLPEQLWEIGQVLQQLSALRTRHKKLTAGLSTELTEALGSQAAALRVAGEAMEHKVAVLERYAGQVREADALFKAEIALQEALQDDDKYVELLARTESAARTGLLKNLTAEAGELGERLTRSIEAVRETGHTFALPVDDTPSSGHS